MEERRTQRSPRGLETAAPADTVESNILRIARIEAEQQRSRTYTERFAMLITRVAGSMPFLYFHFFFIAAWIIANVRFYKFDPFPFFALVTIITIEVLFLSIFILISRNHQDKVDRRQNHLHLQINMLAEQESTRALELLQKIARKVGISPEDCDELLEEVEPEELVKRIAQVVENADPPPPKTPDRRENRIRTS
jgi:uncharacterized membrane protein